jgi:phenylpyruvate tautomerase PptA (4-oxalocrotonate tautomerase family)
MPLYDVLTTRDALDDAQRTALAEGITAIHVEETGAPRSFVHVVFPELPARSAFAGGAPSAPLVVRGQIRAGRPPAVREAILRRVSALCVEVTGTPESDVLVAAMDVPASWAMEGGHIFPDPDPDAERRWLDDQAPAAP